MSEWQKERSSQRQTQRRIASCSLFSILALAIGSFEVACASDSPPGGQAGTAGSLSGASGASGASGTGFGGGSGLDAGGGSSGGSSTTDGSQDVLPQDMIAPTDGEWEVGQRETGGIADGGCCRDDVPACDFTPEAGRMVLCPAPGMSCCDMLYGRWWICQCGRTPDGGTACAWMNQCR
jgi:hypothetical protein